MIQIVLRKLQCSRNLSNKLRELERNIRIIDETEVEIVGEPTFGTTSFF